MPSQLVKCAFGFRSFNDPKTKCVPLSVELGSEQGGTYPRCPPYVAGPDIDQLMIIIITFSSIIVFLSEIYQLNF